MPSREPPWSGYPPTSYPPMSHQTGGHDSMLLGSMLGELKSGQVQIVHALGSQTEVLQRIHGRLEDNAKLMSDRLPPPPGQAVAARSNAARSDPMTWRDWAQIVIAGVALGMAIVTKAPPSEWVPLIGKPFGF